MTEILNPASPEFDPGAVLSSIVAIRSVVPEDALTAPFLGTERSGSGVVIDDCGLVLTIGYLVTEAETVWIIDHTGIVAPGYVMGYDQETGFGLVQAQQPLTASTIELGVSSACDIDDSVIIADHAGADTATSGHIIAKHEFVGHWEYVLDEALFTAPAHPNWGGAALIGYDNRLLGITSIFVQTIAANGEQAGANMSIPIDLLKPILEDMKRYGRPNRPARPWLGFFVQDVDERLIVANTYKNCPADHAGIEIGDLVVEVAGKPVDGLAELFRKIWAIGPAGSEIPLTIIRAGESRGLMLRSIDRSTRVKRGVLH